MAQLTVKLSFRNLLSTFQVLAVLYLRQVPPTVYTNMRPSYTGNPLSNENTFDAELIENSYSCLKRGKAIDLDCFSAEHFQFCHLLLPTVLSKLFNVMISVGHVPPSCCYTYTVPLVKSNYIVFSKSLGVQDFRGISISSVLSKYSSIVY